MSKQKRSIELVVISDVHLGTVGCHADELLKYLKSIKPKKVILNGDIIDAWQFSKKYFPKSHMLVIEHIMSWIRKGTKVYYVTGNHDEVLRKFVGFKVGSFKITNKVVLKLNGKKAWFFHGDDFDVTMQHSKWLARLGAIGYDTLILLNRFVNNLLLKMGKERISLSKRIKNSVKSAVSFINNFEQVAAEMAIENEFDYVVCGHIHQPVMKEMHHKDKSVQYLNSGDWIENLTSLEYNEGKWTIYHYHDDEVAQSIKMRQNKVHLNNSELFKNLIAEFNLNIQ